MQISRLRFLYSQYIIEYWDRGDFVRQKLRYYSTCLQEKHEQREEKLKSIDAKIKASQAAKQQGKTLVKTNGGWIRIIMGANKDWIHILGTEGSELSSRAAKGMMFVVFYIITSQPSALPTELRGQMVRVCDFSKLSLVPSIWTFKFKINKLH